MKLAFSSLCAPEWDFHALAGKAKALGYDGVELRGFLDETILTRSNPFLSDPEKVRDLFRAAGVEVPCISTSVSFGNDASRDGRAAENLKRAIEFAAGMRCPRVKIADAQVKAGQVRGQAAALMGQWLLPLADHAAVRGVRIVIENLLSFRNARELWLLLESIQHPTVGACWDVFNAALIGEVPAVSVPTLNSRIEYVHVKDATFGPLGASLCKLGDGHVRIGDLLNRLKGIGYDGWLCLDWEKAYLPQLTETPEEMLPDALAKLREWIKPQIEEVMPEEASA